jgi:hypothetical protein
MSHAARTYGSDLLNRGMRIETVSKLMGHSDTRTTESCYAELLDETVRAEYFSALRRWRRQREQGHRIHASEHRGAGTLGLGLEAQANAIRTAYKSVDVVEEVASAARASNRPVLQRVLRDLRRGDTLVTAKLDRLARNTRDFFEDAERASGTRCYATLVVLEMPILGLFLASLAVAGGSGRIISSHGVHVVAPSGWHRVRSAGGGNVIDPRTLLVVGTAAVAPRSSSCQIAAYRVQPRGAVVVAVGWRTATSSDGNLKPSRTPLKKLVDVSRPSFECFSGRGAAAQVALGGKAYQVNVMVGDYTSPKVIAEALAVARSFDRVH